MVDRSGNEGDGRIYLKREVGRGAFGVVYEGLWNSMVVAVKVIIFEDNQRGELKRKQNAILETAITTSMVSEVCEGSTVWVGVGRWCGDELFCCLFNMSREGLTTPQGSPRRALLITLLCRLPIVIASAAWFPSWRDGLGRLLSEAAMVYCPAYPPCCPPASLPLPSVVNSFFSVVVYGSFLMRGWGLGPLAPCFRRGRLPLAPATNPPLLQHCPLPTS